MTKPYSKQSTGLYLPPSMKAWLVRVGKLCGDISVSKVIRVIIEDRMAADEDQSYFKNYQKEKVMKWTKVKVER